MSGAPQRTGDCQQRHVCVSVPLERLSLPGLCLASPHCVSQARTAAQNTQSADATPSVEIGQSGRDFIERLDPAAAWVRTAARTSAKGGTRTKVDRASALGGMEVGMTVVVVAEGGEVVKREKVAS